MILKRIIYVGLFTFALTGLTLAQEDIKREVKLYNPFKPALSKENKINFFPVMNDTSVISPVLSYSIEPKAFMPAYTVRSIGAARLEPDPLNKLYKSFLNVGFGNYFSPMGELSISSERSRDKKIGFYANHQSSFGKVKLENDDDVHAGYMDNYASLYATKLFRRMAMSGNIDFQHIRRYAYGYDFYNLSALSTDKDSLKIDYINPSAGMNFYSTRLDSSHLDYNIDLNYDFLMQSPEYYQHNPSLSLDFGYKFKPFYATINFSYELLAFSDAIDNKTQHIVSLEPSIGKQNENWAFRVGADITTYSRDIFDGTPTPDYETKLYIYPDVKFQFAIIPSFLIFYVSLDGEFADNRSNKIIQDNPWLVNYQPGDIVLPSKELFRVKPTNNSLRASGGIMGSAGEYTTYKIKGSYTLFEDFLFYTADTVTGRGFNPLYDDGELLNIYGEFNSKINEKLYLSASANYYNYKLETADYPWYKPTWDAKISLKYNLRNKIMANADIYGLSERVGSYGPSIYTGQADQAITELPMHFSLNLGVEYRYTKILSFWTRLNNISTNRYYEYGFYPSQRFLFMAGFTYSL